jgi:transposase
VIHDGARYHTSQSTKQFFETHHKRITAHPLPSYSPDYNPIEYLWKKTKQRGTHNKYFKEFSALIVSVEEALRKRWRIFQCMPTRCFACLGAIKKKAVWSSSRLPSFPESNLNVYRMVVGADR